MFWLVKSRSSAAHSDAGYVGLNAQDAIGFHRIADAGFT
jgi:hypothetical protein